MSQKSTARRLRTFGLIVFLFFFIITAVLSAFSLKVWQDRKQGEIPGFFGYGVASIDDFSMEPQMQKGSGVFFLPSDPDSREFYQVKDVLVLQLEENGPLSVKRILKVDPHASDGLLYCLKGDAEKTSVWILPEQVLGKVTYNLPFMGNLLDLIRTAEGLIYLILLPCGIFLIVEIILLIAAIIARKKEKKLAAALTPLPDDKDENFVDVTAQYMGHSEAKLQSFLTQKQESDSLVQQMESEEKFARLDYNPLKNRSSASPVRSIQQEKQRKVVANIPTSKPQKTVERVTINTREAVSPVPKQDMKRLTMLVDGSEAAELSLIPGQNFKLKTGDCTVEISITSTGSK